MWLGKKKTCPSSTKLPQNPICIFPLQAHFLGVGHGEGGCCMIINFNKHSEHWAGQRSSSVLPSLNSSHTFCGFSAAVVVEEQWLFSCLKLSALQLGVLFFCFIFTWVLHTQRRRGWCACPRKRTRGPALFLSTLLPWNRTCLHSQQDPVTPPPRFLPMVMVSEALTWLCKPSVFMPGSELGSSCLHRCPYLPSQDSSFLFSYLRVQEQTIKWKVWKSHVRWHKPVMPTW